MFYSWNTASKKNLTQKKNVEHVFIPRRLPYKKNTVE